MIPDQVKDMQDYAAISERLIKETYTDRGLTPPVELIHKAIILALNIQDKVGKKLIDFTKALENNSDVNELKKDVQQFANNFPFPF